MTTGTGPVNIRMADLGACQTPIHCRVAITAIGGGIDMRGAFTIHQDPVLGCPRMAAGAGPDHIGMAELRACQVPTAS